MIRQLCIIIMLLNFIPGSAQVKGEPFKIYLSGISAYVINPQMTYTSAEAQINTSLFEGLVSYHPQSLRPVPGIAESWEWGANKKELIFHLRAGAKYSNGDPIRAQDFVETFRVLLRQDSQSNFYSLLDMLRNATEFHNAEVPAAELGVEARDENTLVLYFDNPNPQILNILCHPSLAPIHSSLREIPNWNSIPIDQLVFSGSHTIVARDLDPSSATTRIDLEANRKYWDYENVGERRIQVSSGASPSLNSLDYNNYIVDWVGARINLSLLEDNSSFQMSAQFATTFFFYKFSNPIWANTDLRKAIALIIPWNEIRDTQTTGSDSNIVPDIPNYPRAKSILSTDIEQAMNLLELAGYPNGIGLPQITVKIPAGLENDPSISIIKEALKEHLNQDLQVKVLSATEYYKSLKKGDYTIGTLSWVGDYPDPLTFLQIWQSSSSLNEFQFNDPHYDELLRQASGLAGTPRLEKLSEAEEYLLQSAVVFPLYHYPSINIINLDSVQGWYKNVLDIHPFKYLKRISILPKYSI